MDFPLEYNGEIISTKVFGSTSGSFQRAFFEAMRTHLEKAGVRHELDGEKELAYQPSLRLTFPRKMESAIFQSIPGGKLIADPETGTIRYRLNLRRPLILSSILILSTFGSFFLFAVYGPLLTRIAIAGFIWLFFIVGVYFVCIQRFKYVIELIMAEIAEIPL